MGAADDKVRCLSARNESFNCAEAHVGDSVLFYKASIRGGAPGRRGPANILDTDDAELTVMFQSQTSKVAQ